MCASAGHPRTIGARSPWNSAFIRSRKARESIEKLGKAKWQALHGVDIEAQISKYQRNYLETHPNLIW